MVENEPPGELALQRWGTRFSAPETEGAFLRWRLEREYAAARLTLVFGTVFVIAAHASMFVLQLPHIWPLSAASIPVYLAIGGQFVTHARRDARALRRASAVALWMECVFAIAVAAASDLRAVAGGASLLLAANVAAFWLAVTVADRFVVGICATYLAAAGASRFYAWSAGQLSPAGLLLEGVLLGFTFVAVPLIVANLERSARTAYRQERIIDAQRATIASQQALLEKELSHQVAERSRELGAVLAKSDVTLDVRALSPGERFAERYKIVSALGAGGMGAVYEVERVTDGQRLALKAVLGGVSGASAARFAREAEIGARVRRPNVVSIVDVGVSSGVPYLVMELVKGGSLEAQRGKFGDVPWALPILRQIAEGLAALHEAGVVHRDLKPANVLLTESGAKISDFGISRFGAIDETAVDERADTMAATPKKSAELTATGVVMGTPLYMAPEGAKTAKALAASADIFALGIIAYEMFTGRAPFAVPAFVLAMADQPIPTPAAIEDARVPEELRVAIAQALASDPPDRPRVREMVAALTAASSA